jgi:serine/threonine protein kinase
MGGQMPIDVGQVVAKKYELVRLLGRGSMGEVWSAHHQTLREQVAIKILAWPPKGEDAEDPSVALERFRFEAQVAARLSRKTRHIARVTDYGEDDGLPYIVMELLDGEALDAALRSRGTIAPAEVAEIITQIARALSQAHAEGVAHRDLKPANVFLSRDEDGRLLVKLLDFGIARTIHAHHLLGTFTTERGFVFGTPGYMSPEQTRASPKLDHRCDLWALATIAYQMLTGHLPVEGSDAEEVMKNVCAGRIVPLRQRDPRLPVAVDAFFDRAFADRVDERFEGAASLAQMFELACGGGTSGPLIPPSVPSLPEPTGNTATEFSSTLAGDALRTYRRQPGKIALASGTAIIAIGVTIAGIRAAWHNEPSRPVAAAPIIQPVQPSAASSLPLSPLSSPLPGPSSGSSSGTAQPVNSGAWIAVLPTAAPPKADAVAPAKRSAEEHAPRVAPAVVPPSPAVVSPSIRSTTALDAPAAGPAPSPRPARATPKAAVDRNDVF